jgi:hypothetical protein
MFQAPLEALTGSRAAPCRILAAALVLTFATGCGVFWGRPEHSSREKLRESKRVSDCRWDARRECGLRARQDESLDVDSCVSEASWRCALDTPGESDDEEKPSD